MKTASDQLNTSVNVINWSNILISSSFLSLTAEIIEFQLDRRGDLEESKEERIGRDWLLVSLFVPVEGIVYLFSWMK